MKGLEGTKLGRYELQRRIAQGGMSEVFLGYDHRVRRQVAVKVLYGSNEPFVRRFEREALAVGALSHDHILPLYDFGEQRPWYYLVMPFVEGGTLRDYLFTRNHLTLDEAGSLLEQIASALQYAHNYGVIHRDVKPSNILLRMDGHAYLVDFGLAKAKADADAHSHSGIGFGTPEYMAPEQSDGINDYRSDIYSLGIILYQMLTGCVPFTADSPMAVTLKHLQLPPPRPGQINTEIPQDIEDIILKALAKKPEERYQDTNEFSNAYKQALLQERIRTQTLPSFASIIIEHSQQELPEDQEAIAPHISRALSSYPFDISPAKPPMEQAHRLLPMEYNAFSLLVEQQEKRRKKRTHLFALALCLLVIVLVLPLTLNFLWKATPVVSRKKLIGVSSTKIAQQYATATAATQIAMQAALAKQAQIQAARGITPPLNAGRILYYNAMTRPGGGWINDGKQCAFSSYGYYVSTRTPHTIAWCYSNQQRFGNAIITAQASLIRGDFYGIVFRLNPLYKTFYVLELNSYSQYRFQRALGRDPTHWLTLIDWSYSSAIYAGYGQRNNFLVIEDGATFRFYINQQLIVSTFSDSAYASGLIGLLVGGDSTKGTKAIFNNVVVLQR
jgi:serine/threonine protein kinase